MINRGTRQKRYESVEKMLDLLDVCSKIGPRFPIDAMFLDPHDSEWDDETVSSYCLNYENDIRNHARNSWLFRNDYQPLLEEVATFILSDQDDFDLEAGVVPALMLKVPDDAEIGDAFYAVLIAADILEVDPAGSEVYGEVFKIIVDNVEGDVVDDGEVNEN